VDLTPSPKLLQMLGEIEFEEWQCIAELVDNAFDSFLEIKRAGSPWPGGFKVSVTLPSVSDDPKDAVVSIRDTGPGMTREQLENAVKAGFSSNDRFTKLGLFGMGFNVSTARLGGFTRVTTTKADDLFWNGVEIDFDAIDDSFNAPELKIEKEFLPDHGTHIEIGKLKQDRLAFLARQEANLRIRLGRVYSYLLTEFDFQLEINGVRVKPVTHCVWGEDRSVDLKLKEGVEAQSAIVQVDHPLAPVDSCQSCGNSQVSGKHDVCSICGSSELLYRERRIYGWLGIQRYISPSDFGIDFLRNGRKILLSDRKLFEWRDPNDPNSSVNIEYPTELAHLGGRIVGEIHLDHVPVTYSKDAFEYSDKAWRSMVEVIRGEGPIRPKRAASLGYPENRSPLGKLVLAFSRNDPGVKCLMPGDGNQAIHAMTRDWGKKFSEGVSEYQTDQKWWEAVLNHERIVADRNKPVEPLKPEDQESEAFDGEEEIFGVFPTVESSQVPTPTPSVPKISAESNDTRIKRLSLEPKLAMLSTDINVPSLGETMSLETFGVKENGALTDTSGKQTAIWLVPGKGNSYFAFLDLEHDLFTKFGYSHYQALAYEIARYLALRADRADESPSTIAAEVIRVNFSGSVLSSDQVKAEAEALIRSVRSLLSSTIQGESQKILNLLTAADQQIMQDEMMMSLGRMIPLQDQDALDFVPYMTILKILANEPELFFDGRVFEVEYKDLGTDSAKFITRSKFSSLLTDIVLAAASDNSLMQPQLLRTSLSASQIAQALPEKP